MFRVNENKGESYWKSYRILEEQLLRLSHSISFDDEQINTYSTELADIIITACVKIESLSKDLYENHILQFQIDNNITPNSYKGKNFDFKKWTRDKWLFDYNCLIEIDNKFHISKRSVKLKTERFNFHKYGDYILPFFNISNDDKGGKWEKWAYNLFAPISEKKFEDIAWDKSYQAIKHNYIESIKEYGTIKNAIITLAGFYMLLVYDTCLPFKQFVFNNSNYSIDFDSKMFECDMCNFTRPNFIIDSEYIKNNTLIKDAQNKSTIKHVYEEQDIYNGFESCMFLVTLDKDNYEKVKTLVYDYCTSTNQKTFDIAKYENKDLASSTDIEGRKIYQIVKNIIEPPYDRKNIKITFNLGTDKIYEGYEIDISNYEKSQYILRTKNLLQKLKFGDKIKIKLYFDGLLENCVVDNISKQSITFNVYKDDKHIKYSTPISNIIYIDKM